MITIVVMLAIVVGAVALIPRVRRANDRRATSWLDAWLKAGVIVVAIALFTVYLPSYVIRLDSVAELDRTIQDVIGASVWLAGFVGVLWTLWYAHRHDQV